MYVYSNPVEVSLGSIKSVKDEFRTAYNTTCLTSSWKILLKEPIFVYLDDIPESLKSTFTKDKSYKLYGMRSTVTTVKNGVNEKYDRYNTCSITSDDIWDMSLYIHDLEEYPSLTLRNLKDKELATHIHDMVLRAVVDHQI